MVSLNEYLIHSAVTQAEKNHPDGTATHQMVVNYLHGGKNFNAMAEYLKRFERVEDIASLLNDEKEAL